MDSWKLGFMNKIAGLLGSIAPASATVLGQTAQASRSSIRAVKRSQVKPVTDSVMKVKTPAPAAPRVEPSTITSTQPSKLAAVYKKLKNQKPPLKPGNEPVVHVNRKPHDF